jgi:hypothetical protein
MPSTRALSTRGYLACRTARARICALSMGQRTNQVAFCRSRVTCADRREGKSPERRVRPGHATTTRRSGNRGGIVEELAGLAVTGVAIAAALLLDVTGPRARASMATTPRADCVCTNAHALQSFAQCVITVISESHSGTACTSPPACELIDGNPCQSSVTYIVSGGGSCTGRQVLSCGTPCGGTCASNGTAAQLEVICSPCTNL